MCCSLNFVCKMVLISFLCLFTWENRLLCLNLCCFCKTEVVFLLAAPGIYMGSMCHALLEQEMTGGSGISWTTYKIFALHLRLITMAASHHSLYFVFYALTACKMTIHKRCEKNVAKNCGINTKDLAEKLKELGLVGKKVCHVHFLPYCVRSFAYVCCC